MVVDTAKRFLTPVAERQLRPPKRALSVTRTGRVFILPGDAPGSMGDEAMVRSVISVAELSPAADVRAVSTRQGAFWPAVGVGQHCFMPWLYRTLPGSSARQFAETVNPSDHFVWLAADTIDGGHDLRHLKRTVTALHIWADQGAKVSVVNFSLRQDGRLHDETRRLLARSATVVVRDDLSATLLRKQVDLPFAVAPDVAYALIDDIVPEENPRTGSIGVNVSGHAVEKEGAAQLAVAVASALAAFAHRIPSLGFELISHDVRAGAADDRPHIEQVASSLASAEIRHWVVPAGLTPASLRAQLATMPLVVTSRMHLAIAALSVGAVPICVTYFHDKFAGQLDLFGLPTWLLIPAATATAQSVSAVLDRAYDERRALQRRVLERLPAIRDQSRAAIAGYLTP